MKPNRGCEQPEPVLVGIEAMDDLNLERRRARVAVGPSNAEKADTRVVTEFVASSVQALVRWAQDVGAVFNDLTSGTWAIRAAPMSSSRPARPTFTVSSVDARA